MKTLLWPLLAALTGASWAFGASPATPAPTAPVVSPAPTPSPEELAADAAAFAAWKQSLSPEQQQWETILQENLGTYYLPIYYRERRAGKTTAWDYVSDNPRLPRVLLIGDSISRAYTVGTRQALRDVANVHRAPENCGPTANGLKKLDLWLGKGKWDVIYFNFGIHDRATPLADYENRLDEIMRRLKDTGARVIWASTTPVPKDDPKHQTPEAIIERNASAARLASKNGIEVDDLFSYITPHVPKTQKAGDVHFTDEGYALLSAHVAVTLRQHLPAH